ncbi:MAG: ribosome biogenesis GTPase YlqF [Halanaerobiales bacterium]
MVQWYPGHMAKAKNILTENLKLTNLVIEMLDARIPASSRIRELEKITRDIERIIILNKRDLANPDITAKWVEYFQDNGYRSLALDSKKGTDWKYLVRALDDFKRELEKKSRPETTLKVMIIGAPNVGKSALINCLAGRKAAPTGSKPGVTRGGKWINITDNIQLFDTPGILKPKFEKEETGYKLFITGAIADNAADTELAAYKLLDFIKNTGPEVLQNNYDIQAMANIHCYDLLAKIGRKRGCLMSGGKVDRLRTAELLLKDYRSGKLGQISLEKPEDVQDD